MIGRYFELNSLTFVKVNPPGWWRPSACSRLPRLSLLLDWSASWRSGPAGCSPVRPCNRAICNLQQAPDWLEVILNGRKEEGGCSVLKRQTLLLQWGHSDTKAVQGYDLDKAGVAPGSEEGRKGWRARPQVPRCFCVNTPPSLGENVRGVGSEGGEGVSTSCSFVKRPLRMFESILTTPPTQTTPLLQAPPQTPVWIFCLQPEKQTQQIKQSLIKCSIKQFFL